jgi:hypothetical protein
MILLDAGREDNEFTAIRGVLHLLVLSRCGEG